MPKSACSEPISYNFYFIQTVLNDETAEIVDISRKTVVNNNFKLSIKLNN